MSSQEISADSLLKEADSLFKKKDYPAALDSYHRVVDTARESPRDVLGPGVDDEGGDLVGEAQDRIGVVACHGTSLKRRGWIPAAGALGSVPACDWRRATRTGGWPARARR